MRSNSLLLTDTKSNHTMSITNITNKTTAADVRYQPHCATATEEGAYAVDA